MQQVRKSTCRCGLSAQIQCQAKTARDMVKVPKRWAGSQAMRCSSLGCMLLLLPDCIRAAVACRYLNPAHIASTTAMQ